MSRLSLILKTLARYLVFVVRYCPCVEFGDPYRKYIVSDRQCNIGLNGMALLVVSDNDWPWRMNIITPACVCLHEELSCLSC